MDQSFVDWRLRIDALWSQFDVLDRDEFLERMQALVRERSPADPIALFELASAHGAHDNEQPAVDIYQQALAAGLPEEFRRQAAIQLASTLRNLGRLDESISLLQDELPIKDELQDAVVAFLALSLINAGREKEAAARTLLTLSQHLPRYRRSVANYAASLLEPREE